MEAGVALLVLLSAILHAGWNVAVKDHGDRLMVLALIMATCSLMGLCAIAWVPAPTSRMIPILAISTVLHGLYHAMLLVSYRHGDLSVVYPIARGIAPPVVSVLSAVWLDETLSGSQWGAVALVSVGIVVVGLNVSLFDRRGWHSAGAAVITGILIAAYTFLDGVGTRVAPSPSSFIAWQFFLSGLPITAGALLLRRGQIRQTFQRAAKRGIGGGIVAGSGYAIVLWALSQAPMGYVASLRETGVLFAAIMGVWLLKEPLGKRRVIGSALIAAGIVMLSVV